MFFTFLHFIHAFSVVFLFEMDEYDFDYDYEEPYLSQPAVLFPMEEPIVEQHFRDTTIQMVVDNCIQPSIISVARNIGDLLLYNLLFNVFTQTGKRL